MCIPYILKSLKFLMLKEEVPKASPDFQVKLQFMTSVT